MLIRPHAAADADRVAEILAAGWKQAYSGFMPAAFLAPRIDPAYRKREIAEWFGEFDPTTEAIFVAEIEGRVEGFVHVEPGDKDGLGATGIVNLLYVDPAMHRRGIGRALLAAGVAWLQQTWPGPLVLSAYRDNPYRHAYAAMGGREVRQVTHLIEGQEIASVLYLWPDVASLV